MFELMLLIAAVGSHLLLFRLLLHFRLKIPTNYTCVVLWCDLSWSIPSFALKLLITEANTDNSVIFVKQRCLIVMCIRVIIFLELLLLGYCLKLDIIDKCRRTKFELLLYLKDPNEAENKFFIASQNSLSAVWGWFRKK